MDFIRAKAFWIACGVVVLVCLVGLIAARVTWNRNAKIESEYERSYNALRLYRTKARKKDYPNEATVKTKKLIKAMLWLQYVDLDTATKEGLIEEGEGGIVRYIPRIPPQNVCSYAESRQAELNLDDYIPHPTSPDAGAWREDAVRFQSQYVDRVMGLLKSVEADGVDLVPGETNAFLGRSGAAGEAAIWGRAEGTDMRTRGVPAHRVFFLWDWAGQTPSEEEMKFASFEYYVMDAFFDTLLNDKNPDIGLTRVNYFRLNPSLASRTRNALENFAGLAWAGGPDSTAPFRKVAFQFAGEIDGRRYPALVKRLGESSLFVVVERLKLERCGAETPSGADPVRVYIQGHFLKYDEERPKATTTRTVRRGPRRR
jgi:hypothetical protein